MAATFDSMISAALLNFVDVVIAMAGTEPEYATFVAHAQNIINQTSPAFETLKAQVSFYAVGQGLDESSDQSSYNSAVTDCLGKAYSVSLL